MTYLVAIAIFILLGIIIVQIGRVTELAAKIRGEEDVAQSNNDKTAFWLVVFMIVFLIACIYSAWYYKDQMLGYGPLTAASEHGVEVDSMFNVTLFFTGIIFVITHILLFWYAYKYRQQEGKVARFFFNTGGHICHNDPRPDFINRNIVLSKPGGKQLGSHADTGF